MKRIHHTIRTQALDATDRRSSGRKNWLLLTLFAMTAILLAFSPPLRRLISTTTAGWAIKPPSTPMVASKSGPHPWGDLESEVLMLEAPTEYLSDRRFVAAKLDWFLPPSAFLRFRDQLPSYDLTAEERAVLSDESRWKTNSSGFYFAPARELLLGLNAHARQQIHSFLGQFRENVYQNLPFRYPQGTAEPWLADSGLQAETQNLVKRCLYQRGPTLCFSDMAILENTPVEEYRRVLKCLTRTRTVFLQLRVTPLSDVNALVQYWGKKETTRRIRPLLESLAKTPDGGTLDVTHLLPAFARERLLSFPDSSDRRECSLQNCLWTALNFFNDPPDDRFADVNYAKEFLRREYDLYQGEPTYGDLVALKNSRGDLVHWCVYIAADVVFTKNGGHVLQPWVLMSLSDVVAQYGLDEPVKVVIFRGKSWNMTAVSRAAPDG